MQHIIMQDALRGIGLSGAFGFLENEKGPRAKMPGDPTERFSSC